MTTDDELLAEAGAAASASGEDEESYGYQPVNWREMDAETAAAAMTELDEWVEWILSRYPIPPKLVPPCWAEHGWLVEELSALHVGWLVCFDPEDSGLGPLQWHERFYQGRERIRGWNGQCTSNEHLPERTRTA